MPGRHATLVAGGDGSRRRAVPTDGFPSMAELLKALARDPARVRQRWFAGAALAAAGVAAFVAGRSTLTARADACRGGEARIAEVWGSSGREAALARLGGLGDYGRSVQPRLETQLQDHQTRVGGGIPERLPGAPAGRAVGRAARSPDGVPRTRPRGDDVDGGARSDRGRQRAAGPGARGARAARSRCLRGSRFAAHQCRAAGDGDRAARRRDSLTARRRAGPAERGRYRQARAVAEQAVAEERARSAIRRCSPRRCYWRDTRRCPPTNASAPSLRSPRRTRWRFKRESDAGRGGVGAPRLGARNVGRGSRVVVGPGSRRGRCRTPIRVPFRARAALQQRRLGRKRARPARSRPRRVRARGARGRGRHRSGSRRAAGHPPQPRERHRRSGAPGPAACRRDRAESQGAG